MPSWTLSSSIRNKVYMLTYFVRENQTIILEDVFRSGDWYCSSESKPMIRFTEDGGFCINQSENQWELESTDIGSSSLFKFPPDIKKKERGIIEKLWMEEGFSGLESLGFESNLTEYWIYDELILINNDTNEEFIFKSN